MTVGVQCTCIYPDRCTVPLCTVQCTVCMMTLQLRVVPWYQVLVLYPDPSRRHRNCVTSMTSLFCHSFGSLERRINHMIHRYMLCLPSARTRIGDVSCARNLLRRHCFEPVCECLLHPPPLHLIKCRYSIAHVLKIKETHLLHSLWQLPQCLLWICLAVIDGRNILTAILICAVDHDSQR